MLSESENVPTVDHDAPASVVRTSASPSAPKAIASQVVADAHDMSWMPWVPSGRAGAWDDQTIPPSVVLDRIGVRSPLSSAVIPATRQARRDRRAACHDEHLRGASKTGTSNSTWSRRRS